MKIKLFLLFLVCSSEALNFSMLKRSEVNDELIQKWNKHVDHHKLSFVNEREETKAYRNFESADRKINEHNSKKNVGFLIGHNSLSHLDQNEIEKILGLYQNKNLKRDWTTREFSTASGLKFFLYNNTSGYTPPQKIDLVESGWNTPVGNQYLPSPCGCCFAYASAGAIDYALWKHNPHHTLITSVQELVDCTNGNRYNNFGCNGGTATNSFSYVKDNGINFDSIYPVDRSTNCKTGTLHENKITPGLVKGIVAVDLNNDLALMEILDKYGAVAVSIDARYSFSNYASGLYECTNPVRTDHAVLLVGYGTYTSEDFVQTPTLAHLVGKKYWRIKNSHGTNFGRNHKYPGYIDISRETSNSCGISSGSVAPLMQWQN